ncbi:cell wall-binding protein [Amnibacterium flavum]|uniref:Cell wall-binding protein n=1 Tax=Amnibacterium flavum TaxID=2173173 RepID=A0A2V1HPZ3_9MICO|nr:cell wall-binding protein [Amnibacterium flavum]
MFIVLQTGLQGGPAMAAEYPSWGEVEAARSDEASKRAQIDQLSSLISQLDDEAAAARAESDERSRQYEIAQAAFDEAAAATRRLDEQTETARLQAESSTREAGRVAAMMARSSTLGVGTEAIMSTKGADALLGRLGAASRLTISLGLVQDAAQRDQSEAAALLGQAEVARAERERLLTAADAAFQTAAEASLLAETKLSEQQQFGEQLKAQLAVLSEDRAATEADFARGQEERKQAEQSSPNLDSGQLSAQGWARPVPGRITDPYGPRPQQPVPGVNPFHYATDLSAGCGTPIYAATDGTVEYAGWFGSYGNWLLLDHGSGVQTGYAHTSQLLVSRGQQVSAGQVVAFAGTTGASTGCHLHYEVRVDDARVDPEPFMSSRGAALG